MKSKLFTLLKNFAPELQFRRSLAEVLLVHFKPSDFFDHWSVQPFNGQLVRHETVFRIIKQIMPTVCIKTGTYLGSTTPYLAGYSRSPTHTIEIDPLSAKKSFDRHQKNFSNLNINNILGDSSEEIGKVLKKLDASDQVVLAYLDAHWLDIIPTNKELDSLVCWGGRFVAIIDDFYVPWDSGYGFDQYGDVVIGETLVPKSSGVRIFASSVESRLETGAKCGTGYVFSEGMYEFLDTKTRNLLQELG